jgi:hypothetical protein
MAIFALPGFSFLCFLFLLNFSCSSQNKNLGGEGKKPYSMAENRISPSDTPPLWKELKLEEYYGINFHEKDYRSFKMFALDSLNMQSQLLKAPRETSHLPDSLKIIIEIPKPDGGFMKFRVYSTSTMDSSLEKHYPKLRTYGGEGVEDATASIRLDFNQTGFHAYVRSQQGEWFIQPAVTGIVHQFLTCFYKRDLLVPRMPELTDSLKK